MPRPEGRRCLVISSQHMTISRHRNGSILHKFASNLPNGSRESTAGSGDDFCILDCVFHEPDSVYYVLDMMCWKGYALYDCSAEFRLFWVQSKLAECMPGPGQEQQRYSFVPVPAFNCSQGESQPLDLSPSAPTVLLIWGLLGFSMIFSMPRLSVLRDHMCLWSCLFLVTFCKCQVWMYCVFMYVHVVQRACTKPTPHQCPFSVTACICYTKRGTTAWSLHLLLSCGRIQLVVGTS